jgi:glycosyltransferase involved in cell wall biosynthesis
MKILFINLSDIKGGASKSMWRLAEVLKDHEIKFIVRDKFSDSDKVTAVGRNWLLNFGMNALGLQYKFLPRSRKIIKLAKEFKPDVISLNQIEGGYFQTRDLIKLSKIAKVVWTMHDLWAFMGNSHREVKSGEKERNIYPQIGLPLGRWLLKMKKKIYDKCDFEVVTPSNYLFHKKLDSVCDKPGYVIPHGIDLKKFKPGCVYKLLYVAEKTSKCDLKEILTHLDGMLNFKIRLMVIGEGGVKEKYKNIFIENVGFIENEDELITYYQDADLFIYPSKADVFGLVLLESQACGLPCIAYKIGGVPEVVKEFLIPEGDSFKFAHTIWDLLTSDLDSHSKKARKQAEKFDIHKIAEKYLECWR